MTPRLGDPQMQTAAGSLDPAFHRSVNSLGI